jgi:hypothetical protein
MPNEYSVTTDRRTNPPGNVRRPLRTAGFICFAGGVIGAVGATVVAGMHGSVSPEAVSYPLTPRTFRFAEVLWTLAHVMTLIGVIGLARYGRPPVARIGRVGVVITLIGMSLMVPTELGFAFIAHSADDSTEANVLSTAIGVAAILSGIGFLLLGTAILRQRSWPAPGRFAPILCGVFVLAVLVPVQAIRPSIFLWPIAGWSVCLALLGLALARKPFQQAF